MYVSMIYKHVV